MSQNMTCPANAPTPNSSSIGATRRRMFLFISIIRESTYRKIGGTPYTCRRRHSGHPIRHCYESMSRTTIRDRLPTRHSAGRKHAPYPDTGPESRGREPRSAGASSQPRIPDTPRFSSSYAAFARPWRFPPPPSSFPRRRESRGGVWVANDPQTTPTISTLIFMPWCAGGNRHGRLLRKLVPDQDPG